MTKLIIGCGYLGLRVAQLWQRAGSAVSVVTRSETKASEFRRAGYSPLVADITQPDSLVALSNLGQIKTVLFAVGWDRHAGQTIDQVYVTGLANVLAHLSNRVERLIYISSTGVYGPASGDWVDESTPCHPERAGGVACLAAEQLLQTSTLADRVIILRLAGIYGPQRIPRAQDLLAGRPIDAPASGFLNLIHVDDAAQIVLLAETQATAPRTYVVSDGQPVLRAEYYAELARLLSAPPPQFVAPSPHSPAAQRSASDKRVSNHRLCQELQPQLLYPSYREGLRAITQVEASS
jgi:nucleoside-diphosphate-sugar epimerase